MGKRVLLHEWSTFFFRDRRVKDGPTLRQFWGSPQEHQEIPLRMYAHKTQKSELNNYWGLLNKDKIRMD